MSYGQFKQKNFRPLSGSEPKCPKRMPCPVSSVIAQSLGLYSRIRKDIAWIWFFEKELLRNRRRTVPEAAKADLRL